MRIFFNVIVYLFICFNISGCGDSKQKSTNSPSIPANPVAEGTTKPKENSSNSANSSKTKATTAVPSASDEQNKTSQNTKAIDYSIYSVSNFPELVVNPMPPFPCNQATPPTHYAGDPGGCTLRVSFLNSSLSCSDQTIGFPGSAKACADGCRVSWESGKRFFTGALCLMRDDKGNWVALKH